MQPIQNPPNSNNHSMPPRRATTQRPNPLARARTSRTPMACLNCRERKVKCLPIETVHGRQCERCIKEVHECIFIPVAQMLPPRDQALMQGSFDAGNAGSISPDGATQGDVLSKNDQWLHSVQANFPSGAAGRQMTDLWDSSHDTTSVGPVNMDYGASSVYEQNFQQRYDGTHDGQQDVSVSHAVDPWSGQAHGSSYNYQSLGGSPFPSTSTSDPNFVGHGSDAIYLTPTEISCSAWTHGSDNCVCPHNCDCRREHRR